MDKIIDGVDVSECEHYRAEIETKMPYGEYEILKDKCHYLGIEIIQDCKGNKGCIYKQLKRLQAEYDDLHLNYAGCKTANTGLQELNEKLQAENERLKEENEELCDRMAKVTYRATGGRLSYSNYTLDAIEQAFYDQLEILSDKESEKYRQTLQEIREIFSHLDENNWFHTGKHIYMDDRCINEIKTRILAKINEVIGAE